MSKILVCGWFITVLVYKWYVKVTKISKIENSGMQTCIFENLVYMSYTRKTSYKDLFFAVKSIGNLVEKVYSCVTFPK